jgi:hypothetical protein
MRWLYLLAGLATLATGAAHAVMGGIDALNPLLAARADMTAKATLMAVWHGQTLFFALAGLALFWAFAVGRKKGRSIGLLLGLFLLAYGGIFAAISYLWFENPMVLPQWTLLAPAGLLALVASM